MTTNVKPVERQCPECAQRMRPTDRFCVRCGHEVGRVPADPGTTGVRWTVRAAA